MGQRPMMDAGPGINFFSLHKERLLFGTMGAMAITETVELEIRRKSEHDQRFAAAGQVMKKIPSSFLEVLCDDVTEDLARVVQRVCNMPMSQRVASGKDLGELMVIAHAVVAAEHGHSVLILMDDGGGRKIAAAEMKRLERLRSKDAGIGGIGVAGTLSVLKKAVGTEHIPDRGAMRELYKKLRGLDDGLPPLESSGLLEPKHWR